MHTRPAHPDILAAGLPPDDQPGTNDEFDPDPYAPEPDRFYSDTGRASVLITDNQTRSMSIASTRIQTISFLAHVEIYSRFAAISIHSPPPAR